MAIIDVQCYLYALPFRAAMPTAHGELRVREGAIVEIITSEGIRGYGEIAPLPAFGGDDLATALAPLPAIIAGLRGQQIAEALDTLRDTRMLPSATVCALETALLDVQGQATEQSIYQLLAPTLARHRPGVAVNAVVGATAIEQAVSRAQAAVAAGFRCIKLKMGSGQQEEIERVAAVRAAIGPAVHLRLDANEGWHFSQAVAILSACAGYDLQYVEQPLKAANLQGMHELRREVPIPLAADEAIIGFDSARRILAMEAADVLIIKPQLTGGLRASQQLMYEASERGIQCVVTSTMESSVGVVAALHLAAASPIITLECGLATLDLLADDLVVDSPIIHEGFMALPTQPGLGVRVDKAALAQYTHNPAILRGAS
jgi:o-succinylbenzoate synthase